MIANGHVIVWIDHSQARVFAVGEEDAEGQIVLTHARERHLHHKANSIDSGRAPLDREFFERVVATIAQAGALLIVGPANAKTELVSFIEEHHPMLNKRIRAVETLDHPSDGQLVAMARKFFTVDDRNREVDASL